MRALNSLRCGAALPTDERTSGQRGTCRSSAEGIRCTCDPYRIRSFYTGWSCTSGSQLGMVSPSKFKARDPVRPFKTSSILQSTPLDGGQPSLPVSHILIDRLSMTRLIGSFINGPRGHHYPSSPNPMSRLVLSLTKLSIQRMRLARDSSESRVGVTLVCADASKRHKASRMALSSTCRSSSSNVTHGHKSNESVGYVSTSGVEVLDIVGSQFPHIHHAHVCSLENEGKSVSSVILYNCYIHF